MKIELSDNKVFFESNGSKKEIHPFWLRERVNGESYVDKGTQQRLFDPTELKGNIEIKNVSLSGKFLEVSFNDGAETKLTIQSILNEFSNTNDVKFTDKIKWDSSLTNLNNFEFSKNIFEEEVMYEALISFYKYGFTSLSLHVQSATNTCTDLVCYVILANSVDTFSLADLI